MRYSLAFLVAVSFAISACANMSPGVRPNGWAKPTGTQTSGRTDAAPVRVVSSRNRNERAQPEREHSGADSLLPEEQHDLPPVSAASGLMLPVVGVKPEELSDSFDAPRSGGRTHRSIDISAPSGTPLVAVVDGTITRKHWNRLGGRTLYLTSADGRYDYYYAHLSAYEDGIEIGTEVEQGDVLGTVGSTGNARGPHLHFQVLDKRGAGRGTPVNPYDLLHTDVLVEAR